MASLQDPSFVPGDSPMNQNTGNDNNSMQTIDADSGHGGDQTTGTYLDHYLELERAEREGRAPKNNTAPQATTNLDGNAASPTPHADGYGYHNGNVLDPNNKTTANTLAADPSSPAAASSTAMVAIPSKEDRPLDETKPRIIEMTYTEDELRKGRTEFFDTPDPAFYLGAALLIGCVCLFTWMTEFIVDHGDIESKYLWIITCGIAALTFIVPFVYYCVSSKHYHCCGKFWDGICGAVPCLVAAFGLTFVYAFGVEAIVNTVHYGTKKAEFLVYGTLPLFLLVVLPAFFAMLKFQDRVSQEIRNNDPNYAGSNTYASHPITSSGFIYMGVMLRRVIVGWVTGVCLAAHMALPAYGLSWAAYGLYLLAEDKGIWVIFVIVIPPILILIALAIIPVTRIVPLCLLYVVIMWYYYPLMDWDPRKGGFWLKYDNGITAERLVAHYNYEVREAQRAYVNHQNGQADAHYTNASTMLETMRAFNVKFAEVDYATGKISDKNRAPATIEEAAAAQQKGEGPAIVGDYASKDDDITFCNSAPDHE